MSSKNLVYASKLISKDVGIDMDIMKEKIKELLYMNKEYGDKSIPLAGYLNDDGGFSGCLSLEVTRNGRAISFSLVLYDEKYKEISRNDLEFTFLSKQRATIEQIVEQIYEDEIYLKDMKEAFIELKCELERI